MSDVALVAAATEEWAGACAVCDGIGIAHHTAQGSLQLQLIDLGLHICHAVAADGVQDLLCAALLGLDNVAGVDSAIVVDAVNAPLDGAATVGQLSTQGVKIPQSLIAEVTQAVLKAGVHVGDGIAVTGNALLQLRERLGAAQICLGNCIAPGISPASAAHHDDEKQNEDDTPGSAKHTVIAVGYGLDVRNRGIIHFKLLS